MSDIDDALKRTLAKYAEGITLAGSYQDFERLTNATVTALKREMAQALTSDDRKVYVVIVDQSWADSPLYYVKYVFERREDAEAYIAEHETYRSGISGRSVTDCRIEEVPFVPHPNE